MTATTIKGKQARLKQVQKLSQDGLKPPAIAKRLQVSRSTVYRDLSSVRSRVKSSKAFDTNENDTLLGIAVGRGGVHPITTKSLRRNVPFDAFMGINNLDLLLTNNPQGLARAFSVGPWVYRNVKVLSTTAGSIPLKVTIGEDEAPPSHSVTSMFSGNRSRLMRDTVSDRAIFGVAYWLPLKKVDRSWIRRLNPLTIKVIGGLDGIRCFRQYIGGQMVNEWSPEQLIFIPEYNPENDLGYVPSSPAETDVDAFISPMMLSLRALNVDLAAWEFVRVFFENDATPSYILTTDQILQQADMQRVIDNLQERMQGVENSHRPAIFHGGLKVQQLTAALKDLVIPELDERTIRRICAVFGVPLTMALATDAANFATAEVQRKMFYTETVLPEIDMILDEVNVQFVSRFWSDVKVIADTDNVEVLQEDQTEVTDRASKGYISGFRSFNEARELDGIDPIDEKYDFVLIGGQPVLVADIAVGKLPTPPEPQQPQSPFGFNFGAGGYGATTPSSSAGIDIDRRLSDMVASNKHLKAGATDAYVVLSLANDPTIIEQVKQLKTLYPDLEYLPENDYHITVLYLPTAPQQVVDRIAGSLSVMPPLSLRVRSLGIFENDSNNLHFQVEPNQVLQELQRNLYDFATALGAKTSEYSIPTNYRPHVSIGYSSQPLRIEPIMPFEVKPTAMILNIDDGTDEYEIIRAVKQMPKLLALPEPVKNIVEVVIKSANEKADPVTAIEDAFKGLIVKDLDKWCSKSARLGTQTAFNPDYLPKALAGFIKMDLRALHVQDGALDEQITTLFDRYKQAVKQVPDENLATPEEFEAYWNGVDDSFDDIIALFEKHWQGLNAKVADAIREQGAAANLETIIDDHTKGLLADLIGTEDNPAPLSQLFLAGAARGNDLYERHTAKSVKQDTRLTIDWKFVNQEAVDWARNHAATMVRGINQTTLSAYQDAIAKWIEGTGDSGDGSMGNLAAAIEGQLSGLTIPSNWSPAKVQWATSPERAALIAQTESTNAFSKGVTERWKQVGVEEIIWRTQNDSRVCPLCKRLNNVKGSLEQGVFDSATGEYYKPAAHVGCRCFEAPVV